MRIAIMQPTYLPWLGYFNLVAQADSFVFLDDVQFSPRSWQQRNRIVEGDQLAWLTVPVRVGGRSGQPIHEVEVADEFNWRRKHLARLAAVYGKAPFGKATVALVAGVLDRPEPLLSRLNIALITAIARHLGLDTPFHRATDLQCGGGRSDHLLNICRALGGERYLSAAGSRDYIEADGVFADAGFAVSYQAYRPPAYRDAAPLLAGEFPSILDALAWVGPDRTREMILQDIA